ncbi:MAG: EF-P lysine aminoacylase GenX [Myxococcales bacterium]|nr:MAG: EF-P lysine aminoacylase GenX [Myxococcales bacterium]
MLKSNDRTWFSEQNGKRRKHIETRARIPGLRTWYSEQDYLEVQTPSMVPSPGTEVHLDAFVVEAAKNKRFLCTSPEYQMKRLLSAGFDRIYQVAHCFRAEELGSLHEPEFCMLEWYRTQSTLDDVLKETERLIASIHQRLQGSTTLTWKDKRFDLSPPWPRISVQEAFAKYARHDALRLAAEDEEQFYRVLIEQVEPQLGHERPCFLVDYPASMASLAKLKESNPAVAERAEAYIAGIELCNAYGELTDAKAQRQRCLEEQAKRKQLGKAPYPLDEKFLAALEHGLPPCAGNALGLDRLIMLFCNADSLQDVLAFSAERA